MKRNKYRGLEVREDADLSTVTDSFTYPGSLSTSNKDKNK